MQHLDALDEEPILLLIKGTSSKPATVRAAMVDSITKPKTPMKTLVFYLKQYPA